MIEPTWLSPAPGHGFRHSAAADSARVRAAEVGGEELQEAERGPVAGGGARRRHGVGRLWADGMRVGVEYDGEPRGQQRGRRMLPGGSAGNRDCG
jgi:hypothetical protein